MRTRFICPFCRTNVVEIPSSLDPAIAEDIFRDHLLRRHPIRRRLSRRVRTALREVVPTSSGWITGPAGPADVKRGSVAPVRPRVVAYPVFGFRDGEWYGFRFYRLPTDEQAEHARQRLDARDPGWGWTAEDSKDRKIAAKTPIDIYEFFAIATSDPATGFLELREIQDPWLCSACGKSYQDGAHTDFGFAGADAHDYVARGAAA